MTRVIEWDCGLCLQRDHGVQPSLALYCAAGLA